MLSCIRPFPLQWSSKLICFKHRNSLQAHQNLQETGESFVNSSVERVGTYWAGGTRGLEENGRWRYNLSFPKFLFHLFWLLSQISVSSVWEILRSISVIVILQNLQIEKKDLHNKSYPKGIEVIPGCHRWIRQEFHHHCLTIKYSFSNLIISYPAPALVHLNILRTSRDHVHLGYCWWGLAPALAGRQGDTQALVAARGTGEQPPGSSCGWEWAVPGCAGTEPCTHVFVGEVFADAATWVLPAPQGNIYHQRKKQHL